MDKAFEEKVIAIITEIPKGKVLTYGEIATEAGNKMGARDVSEILHFLSEKHHLPWQRVINAQGEIAFSNNHLAQKQRRLLEEEGIVFRDGKIDPKEDGFKKHQSDLGGFF